MAEKIIGVLGGLGPWATADLFEKILRLTPARRDQDHLRVIIDSNPKVPDRSAAILGRGEDPTPELVATARNLERAGADLLVIPCNTAHAFYGAIAAAVRIPVLHIMEEVAAEARRLIPGLRRAGVLATTATIAAGLYHRAFEAIGAQVLTSDEAAQQIVTRLIYGVKAGRRDAEARGQAAAIARDLIRRGAQAIVLGCTELPFLLQPGEVSVPLLDSNLILAQAAVRSALAPAGVPRRQGLPGQKSSDTLPSVWQPVAPAVTAVAPWRGRDGTEDRQVSSHEDRSAARGTRDHGSRAQGRGGEERPPVGAGTESGEGSSAHEEGAGRVPPPAGGGADAPARGTRGHGGAHPRGRGSGGDGHRGRLRRRSRRRGQQHL
ncbi:MAG: amino acid racemase [Armatimonadota bacterium]|nr:amino acid racemase [Armatimonadota bacterium]MDR7451779.1 amino acid racemase [Armatimonadota bacterium]MDR7467404.1 amino acid racemase [Armatimonadota bacterium]MDR7494174.1 amino acid racemase [Armatimonadota bacterium]MDR7498860.1 amino acid racemase [Armatimonadota bacterium]